jgi:hypothetical protein
MQLYPHDFSQIAPPSARAIDTFASRAAGGRHDLSFPVTADKDGSAKARP